MKFICTLTCLFVWLLATSTLAQDMAATPPPPLPSNAPRVSFMLKNTLGYHRLFRAYGPGIAYGFTMGRRETTPKNWPVGTGLYFSPDGETNGPLILTVTAADEGKTLTTDTGIPAEPSVSGPPKPTDAKLVTVKLFNPSFLPKRFALISYEPGKHGNGTSIFRLMPRVSKSFTFPVGTRLYLANNAQVDIVMSGKSIDSGKPFHVVMRHDAGETITLN